MLLATLEAELGNSCTGCARQVSLCTVVCVLSVNEHVVTHIQSSDSDGKISPILTSTTKFHQLEVEREVGEELLSELVSLDKYCSVSTSKGTTKQKPSKKGRSGGNPRR